MEKKSAAMEKEYLTVHGPVVFQVIEKFVSIDGEGPTSGMLAVFIRFNGCNLRCAWCDTAYSWEPEAIAEEMTADEICAYIHETRIKHVTLTGGEPLIQEGIEALLEKLLQDKELLIHIETNGSVDISPFKARNSSPQIRYIVDYKLPGSGMTNRMAAANLEAVGGNDVYKFVLASEEDLEMAFKVIEAHDLCGRCLVYFSPITKLLSPAEVVEFMKEKKLGKVRLQLQLHKIIWSETQRGV
jgi:7-carboxy-7-deazaguanine synthase